MPVAPRALLASADTCFSLISLCCCLFQGVPVLAWVTHGCSHFVGVPAPERLVLGFLPYSQLSSPTSQICLLCEGHLDPVLECSPKWHSLQELAESQRAQMGTLHPIEAAPSRSTPPLSLHHTSLRCACTHSLVKACQNSPFNPLRKDLI